MIGRMSSESTEGQSRVCNGSATLANAELSIMLIAPTLASRMQSIHLLSISKLKTGYDIHTLQYSSLLKQSTQV